MILPQTAAGGYGIRPPTEDVILEEAINKGRGRRRKAAGGIYAAPTGGPLGEWLP